VHPACMGSVLAGPASEPEGARPVGGFLAGPTSKPVRARLEQFAISLASLHFATRLLFHPLPEWPGISLLFDYLRGCRHKLRQQ
jgi:hypothetical protein